jgi:hypothetical protein
MLKDEGRQEKEDQCREREEEQMKRRRSLELWIIK